MAASMQSVLAGFERNVGQVVYEAVQGEMKFPWRAHHPETSGAESAHR